MNYQEWRTKTSWTSSISMTIGLALSALCSAGLCLAQDQALTKTEVKPAGEAIVASGINGTIIMCGGETFSDQALRQFERTLPRTETAVLVLRLSTQPSAQAAEDHLKEQLKLFPSIRFESRLLTNNSASEVVADVGRFIETAQAVCIVGDSAEIVLLDSLAEVRRQLQKLIQRKGSLVAHGEIATALGAQLIPTGQSNRPTQTAMGILDRTLIAKLEGGATSIAALELAIEAFPDHLGIGLEVGSTIVIQGRQLLAMGSPVRLALAGCSYRSAELTAIENQRADLTQWLRAAAARKNNVDPGLPQVVSHEPAKPEKGDSSGFTENDPCQVAAGALVIVGGGRMPELVVDEFVKLAGSQEAHIVYLPTAVPPHEVAQQPAPRFLDPSKIASITTLPQTGPEQIASAEFQNAMAKATGVWFGGGRQWNFVDAYEGTNAIELFHQVLKRGGVIGGSSAGATIQGEFLVRGHPLGNTVMMAEGYERGFNFLPGTAIDQHFSQRNRFADLELVIRKHPKLLGIGIDEGTALVVRGSAASVIGDGSVHFLNEPMLRVDSLQSRERYRSIPSGQTIEFNQLGIW